MSAARYFLDTNVVVYANDRSSPAKQARALELMTDAFRTRNGCVSVQVMQEFFAVATRKEKLAPAIARAQVASLEGLGVVETTPELILSAIDLHLIHGVSFWDALIVKAAAAGGCRKLYSEDLQGDRVLDGVRIVNPFAGL